MIVWDLTYQATATSPLVTKTLANWGITNFKRRRVSQAPDEISFTTAEKSTTDPQFAYDGKVTVTAVKDGESTVWFVGWIGDPAQSLSGTQERRNYKAKNAWKWFDQIVFQKVWYRAVNPASAASSLVGGYRSQMILNMGFNGSHQTIQQQMTDVVAFVNQMATAEGLGNLIQLGVCPVTTPPWSDVNDITVGEVVKHQMRWMPDAVTAFDYTTTPPTLNIRNALTPLTINLNEAVINTVGLTPRNDRVVERVRIKYAQQNNTNGKAWVYDVWDIYPVPPIGTGTFLAEAVGGGYYYISAAGTIVKSNTPPINGVVGTIPAPPTAPENTFKELLLSVNMVGWVSNYVSATIETMPWGSGNWLQQKLPFLRARGSFLSSYLLQKVLNQDGSEVSGGYLANDVLTGSLVDGLRFTNGNSVTARQYTAIYGIDHQQTIAGTKNSKSETQTIKFTATNASSGTYSGLQSSSSGDPIPLGLAQSLYDGLKILQHDGSVTIKSREIDPSRVWIGNRLSIVGGSSYWQNMMIQTVEESVDMASVTVSVGVPRYLSAGDLVELLRVTRFRQRFIAPDTVTTGQSASGSASSLPKNTNADNSVGGHSIHNVQTFTSASPVNDVLPTTHLKVVVNAEAGSFIMQSVGPSQNNSLGVAVTQNSDISMLLSDCKGRKLSVREYTICVNNVNKKVLLLGSEPFL